MTPLPDIEILLPSEQHAAGDIVTVQLQAAVSEVGTLTLEAVSTTDGARWQVALDTRASSA